MSCSSRPSMWTAPNPLRKQNSCLDGYSSSSAATTSSTSKSNYRIGNNNGKPTLHKQMSVDHQRINNNNRIVNNGQNQNTWSDGKPEASLRIFTAVKKRTPSSSVGCTENSELVYSRI